MKLTSHVEMLGGVPTLFVNNKPCYEPAYMTYLPEKARFDSFCKIGVHLYSTCVYFGSGTINPRTNLPIPMHDGIFEDPNKPDFTIADEVIAQIIREDPQAMIFPRVSIAPPPWWEKSHPEELLDNFRNPRFPDLRVCFASKLWWEYTAECLKTFCDHYENSPFQDHLVGYQLSCGATQEWFAFDDNGGFGLRMREAFEAWQGEDKEDESAMYRFASEVTADTIAFMAKKVKEYTNNRVVVGAFYGYTLEPPAKGFTHCGVSKLLQCKDLDFLCSPMSYMESRRPGIDHANMTLLDSILLHGKLYFTECDERTFISKYPGESGVPVQEGTYREALWLGPPAPIGRHVLRNDFARCLTHGTNFWWFDMWGGWYEYPSYMQDMQEEIAIMEQSAKDENRGNIAEVAVLMDEKSLCYLEDKSTIPSDTRIPLGSAGAPYAMYEMADYEAVKDKYSVFIVIEPYETKRAKGVKAEILAEGKKLLVVSQPKATVDMFYDFYRESGVHLYCHDKKVVHVNENYISVHNDEKAGEVILYLPRARKAIPMFEPGEEVMGDRIPLYLEAFETRMFRLED